MYIVNRTFALSEEKFPFILLEHGSHDLAAPSKALFAARMRLLKGERVALRTAGQVIMLPSHPFCMMPMKYVKKHSLQMRAMLV